MFRSKIWALLPLLVFIVLYLATSLALNDYYKMSVIVVFLLLQWWPLYCTHEFRFTKRRNILPEVRAT
jgi:hypothetical protein